MKRKFREKFIYAKKNSRRRLHCCSNTTSILSSAKPIKNKKCKKVNIQQEEVQISNSHDKGKKWIYYTYKDCKQQFLQTNLEKNVVIGGSEALKKLNNGLNSPNILYIIKVIIKLLNYHLEYLNFVLTGGNTQSIKPVC